MANQAYDHSFYTTTQAIVRQSAVEIVPLLLDLIRPGSVVDVGCGVGTWLSVFRQHGVEKIHGVDGEWVDLELLEIPPKSFTRHDLTLPLPQDSRYDLVVSLEVAEHLPCDRAEAFVTSLTRLGPVVFFSAAIPLQGGTCHINEQWPEYWVKLFDRHKYTAVDCIRKQIWDNERVAWYYSQNSMLFVEDSFLNDHPGLQEAHKKCGTPASLVHPQHYLQKMRWMSDPANLGIRDAVRAIPALAGKVIAKLYGG